MSGGPAVGFVNGGARVTRIANTQMSALQHAQLHAHTHARLRTRAASTPAPSTRSSSTWCCSAATRQRNDRHVRRQLLHEATLLLDTTAAVRYV